MLLTTGLVAQYPSFRLGPVDLGLERGLVVLAGHNGAGKSTLMRCLIGLQRPTSGQVTVDGGDPYRRRDRYTVNARIGYCPQEVSLPRLATVRQVLHYAAWLKKVSRTQIPEHVARASGQLQLDDLLDRPVASLSGGMKRRVAIGQALVHDPMMVVLDEPSAGLDPVQRVALRNLLQQIARDRLLLVSTHLVEDVAGVADHVVVLREGTAVFQGDVPALEATASATSSGHTAVERALWTLLDRGEGA
jgi:ABC-2 type transport system ATP-binding protein